MNEAAVPTARNNLSQRILVVDDEQYVCDVCARALTRASYSVVATTNVGEALTLLRSQPSFDLLITDIKMPSISGLELARQAREIDPALAIIIMTGHASMENLLQAVQRGVADFLAKPFEIEQLRLAVEQALHKRFLMRENERLRAIEDLLRSSEAINATLDYGQLVQITLQAALQLTNAQTGFLLIQDSHDRLIELLATQQLKPTDTGRRLAMQAYLSQSAQRVEHTEPLCVDQGQLLYRGLFVPIRAPGQIVGVLVVCDQNADILRTSSLETLALLTSQAGSALRNAALYSQLQETYQRLQELDRLKSEFISIASHELRTPLSIVLGYTMMMRDHSEGERRDYLQRILDNAQRIKDIVDDMVNLRHLETGQLQLNLEELVVQDMIRQAVEQMRPAAQIKHQHLELELPEQELRLASDREKLLLILGNLISNAIKFTPPQGRVIVRALQPSEYMPALATLSNQPDQHWVVIAVQDNGIGISQREQSRIFDRFYQVAESLTRDHGGTGLGLAIVRELVNLLGGTVWVESTEGTGSTFSFALPLPATETTIPT